VYWKWCRACASRGERDGIRESEKLDFRAATGSGGVGINAQEELGMEAQVEGDGSRAFLGHGDSFK
jgi:hypothetical protein